MSTDDSRTTGSDTVVGDSETPSGHTTHGWNLEDVFQVLSNARRRYAVYVFLTSDEKPDLGELSRYIAAWENEKSVEQITSEERRRVYNSLEQEHLPKMDEAGFIEYDSGRHRIEETDGIAALRPYMETIPETNVPWCLYYSVLGGIGVLLAASAVTGVGPFTVVSGWLSTLAISVLLLGSGLVHAFFEVRGLDGPERD